MRLITDFIFILFQMKIRPLSTPVPAVDENTDCENNYKADYVDNDPVDFHAKFLFFTRTTKYIVFCQLINVLIFCRPFASLSRGTEFAEPKTAVLGLCELDPGG